MNPLESFSVDTTDCAAMPTLAPRLNGWGRPMCPVCGIPALTIEETQGTTLEGWPVMGYRDWLRCRRHGDFQVAVATEYKPTPLFVRERYMVAREMGVFDVEHMPDLRHLGD